jgi:diadenosine tetraphosphate (Ap4A) HIT family hydrolase
VLKNFISVKEYNDKKNSVEFLYKIRKKMRERLSIRTIYIIQEETDAHFHVWLFPRYDWMEQFGKKISSVIPIMKWAQENLKNPESLKQCFEYAEKLKN